MDLSIGTAPVNLTWSPADAIGDPHSGSARVAMQQSGIAIVAGSPCLTLKAGGSYVFRTWTWIENAGPADLVIPSVGFYSDPACTSALRGSGTPGDSTVRGWQEVSGLVGNLTTDVFVRPWFVIDDKPPRGVVAYFDDVSIRTGTCAPSPEVLCLNDGRFAVNASWRTADGTREQAAAVPFSSDSGSFWFFSPTNLSWTSRCSTAAASTAAAGCSPRG